MVMALAVCLRQPGQDPNQLAEPTLIAVDLELLIVGAELERQQTRAILHQLPAVRSHLEHYSAPNGTEARLRTASALPALA